MLLFQQGDLWRSCVRVLTSSPGAPGRQLCGLPMVQGCGGTQRGADVTFVLSPPALGLPLSAAPALRGPGCCLDGLRERRETLRGRQKGRQPLAGPGAISGDTSLTVWGHTVWTSRPVCSVEAALLLTPRQRDRKGGHSATGQPGLAQRDPRELAHATMG